MRRHNRHTLNDGGGTREAVIDVDDGVAKLSGFPPARSLEALVEGLRTGGVAAALKAILPAAFGAVA